MDNIDKTTLSLTRKTPGESTPDSNSPAKKTPRRKRTPRKTPRKAVKKSTESSEVSQSQTDNQAVYVPPTPVPFQECEEQQKAKLSMASLNKFQSQVTEELYNLGSQHQLANTWVIWYHRNPKDWSLSSYYPVWEFSTIQGFWAFENNRPPFADSYVLLMKKGHPPIWEVPENKHGGSWGFKFPKKVADKQWLEFSLFLIGETMANDTSQLIGLSMSPKIYNVTIKIWNKDSDQCKDQVEFREEINRHKPLYKEFRDHKD